MQKKVLAVLLFFSLLMLSACQPTMSKPTFYAMGSDESLRIDIDSKSGFFQNGENPFKVSKGGKTYLNGAFAPGDTLEFYANYADTDDAVTLIERAEKDGHKYIFFKTELLELDVGLSESDILGSLMGNDAAKESDDPAEITEYSFMVKIADKDVCVVMSSILSEEMAKEAFDAMTFSVVSN